VIEVPLKIHLPFGERYKVMSIASDIEDLGNRVAEGDLHTSMFWPELAKRKHRAEKRANRELFSLRKEYEEELYRQGWVSRWLEQEGYGE
jgi:hypothetical protein